MTGSAESLVVACGDVAATRAAAAAVVPHLRAGDALLLVGDLGAGKTAFTQGLASAAGVRDAVTSPTFALMRPYPTDLGLDLLHVDVYRLATTESIANLGLSELLEDDAFAVIEWGERAAAVVGPDHLEIRFTPAGDDGRLLEFASSAPSWTSRWPALRSDLIVARPADPLPCPP